jgi:hypothetical protein
MTIYVDDVQRYPSGQWCHMATDGTLEELHAFALHLGLKRSWFQNKPRHPHYDLRPTKRILAIQKGAKAVDSFELISKCFHKEG